MTKIIFHGFYYCTLIPGAFFMSTAALFVSYHVDKFCILRTWEKAPMIGFTIGKINMIFILPCSVLVMTVMSSYWWSGFPFDNLCENGVIDYKYVGEHFVNHSREQDLGVINLVLKKKSIDSFSPELFVVNSNATSYEYCNQNLFEPEVGQFRFPALSSWQYNSGSGLTWMTSDQELVTQILGWTSVGVLVLISLRFAWFAKKYFVSFFRSSYKPRGEDRGINFSSVKDISCYIPQASCDEFSFPLIAARVDDVDTGLFEWKDPDRSYEYYNITLDARKIMFGEDKNKELPLNVFSKVYHYPPTIGPNHSVP